MPNAKPTKLSPSELVKQLHLMGLSDSEVAKEAGCSTSFINRIRRGSSEPKWDVYDRIVQLHKERMLYIRKELGL
jgi:predicted transcriptional regulator